VLLLRGKCFVLLKNGLMPLLIQFSYTTNKGRRISGCYPENCKFFTEITGSMPESGTLPTSRHRGGKLNACREQAGVHR
jgi:hypothetical protein